MCVIHRSKPWATIFELPERLHTSEFTYSKVPGIILSTKGVIPNVAPESTTIGALSRVALAVNEQGVGDVFEGVLGHQTFDVLNWGPDA